MVDPALQHFSVKSCIDPRLNWCEHFLANMESTEIVRQQVNKRIPQAATLHKGPPKLNDYFDFRKYLADYYQHRRDNDSGRRPYSYSVFSAAANIKSPTYLKLVIEGKRNLSIDMAKKFSKALHFNKEFSEEFKWLTLFTQASDAVERNRYFLELTNIRLKQRLNSGELNQNSWEKAPDWISWLLYSMVDQDGVVFEPEALMKLMRGKANLDTIKNSLRQLFEGNHLIKDETTGEITKSKSRLEDIPAEIVRKLQSDLIYLGMESLFEDCPTEREIGALTLALTKQEFEQIKFDIRQLRKRINCEIGVNREFSKGDRVYQLNFQLFPISDKAE